uniref:KN motif and ankyrin repeat domains 4 n=1 Tax=Gasterosteus aculeatus aculeatus TaxID=481459 RepID=G3PUV0_GASAC|nr:KN motif and ankyrin repeat domain-containing protein 4-like isoform X2 [Gasterosteus aculeatus aculeatus]
MEEQNGNIRPHKTTGNGIKGKPPYSVETPYGFQLDLDFLKYVDDIEKGNTIKRVPIKRRSRCPRASTLPRQLNPSGCGYRPSPWGSTGALGPRFRLSDHHGYASWSSDHRPPHSPTGLKSLAEMEARMKEFDEQPFGEHVRPHLPRASSMPITVLLRQGSESSSLGSSRDPLGERDASCEDVFNYPDSPRPQECAGLYRRLADALERVGELEMEVRVVPELRAHICVLQEERERLRRDLDPHAPPSSVNGTRDPCASSHYGRVDIKRLRHESGGISPRNHSGNVEDCSPKHEWRTSTDLDELLTVTSLQAKVAALEQKLHETSLELQMALGLLRDQMEESRKKDEKMEHIMRNAAVVVRAERGASDRNGDDSIEPYDKVSRRPDARIVRTNGQRGRQWDKPATTDAGEAWDETAVVAYHIEKVKRLLCQQWECLCVGHESGKGKSLQHPDPKVNSLQQEMMGLVEILTSYYSRQGAGDGERRQHGASKCIARTDGCALKTKSPHSVGVDEGRESGNVVGQDSVSEGGQKESSINLREMAAVQVDGVPGERRMEGMTRTNPGGQMISGGAEPGRTDGSAVSPEAEKTAKTKPQPPGEQMERRSGSGITTRGRETVNLDFLAACHLLKDHMDHIDNPNEDMRKALVVLFQHWFSAAAEETSEAGRVSAYLSDVKKTTPSLLAFLINLADDNGNTALHYSVSHCNHSIVSLILDTGVSNVGLQNNAGFTAVMLASLTAPDGPGGMEVVRRLMEQSNINIRSSQTGQTALHLAVRHGRVVMVRLLLSFGADTNLQDKQGTTALMFASERGHTHIARLLLERSRCDLTLTDKRGQTALSIAMQGSHTDTAALLQAHAKARAL